MKQEDILEIKKSKEDLQNTVKFLEADVGKYSLEAEAKRDRRDPYYIVVKNLITYW